MQYMKTILRTKFGDGDLRGKINDWCNQKYFFDILNSTGNIHFKAVRISEFEAMVWCNLGINRDFKLF